MAVVVHTPCLRCGQTTQHLLVDHETEVCTRCAARDPGPGEPFVSRGPSGLRIVAGSVLAGAAILALLSAATTTGENEVAALVVFLVAALANWAFWTLPRPAPPQGRRPPWRSCPYCPPHRSGDAWYGQPAAWADKDDRWAWCGRCGAMYLRSTGKWQRPDPEAWERTFRQEAPR